MEALWWILAGIIVLIFAYVLVRTVSVAYYRTKREYLGSLFKDQNKGE